MPTRILSEISLAQGREARLARFRRDQAGEEGEGVPAAGMAGASAMHPGKI